MGTKVNLTLMGCAIASAIAAPPPARAEESGSGRFDLGVIETVQVTAQRISEWNAPVTATITADETRDYERYDVADAVNLLPGVTIQGSGSRNERLVYVRGFNSRQVPVFIDGIPVYVPYDGNVDLGRFTTFDVAQIAVSKTMAPLLYGANTLGGSINLISRRPERELEAEAGAGIVIDDDGDAGRYRTWANVGANRGNWYAQGGGSWTESDHFRLSDDFDATAFEDGGRRENSRTEDWKVNIKVGYMPNDTDEYAVSYINQQGEKEQPPYAGTNPFVRARFWQWPEWDKESVYFISNTALGDTEYVKVRAYYDMFDNTLSAFDDATYTTQFLPFAFDSVYDDYTAGGTLELGTSRWQAHDLRAAFHYKRDVHRESDDVGAPEERYEDEIMTLGVEDTITVTDNLTLLAGASYAWQDTLEADNSNGFTITPFPTDSANAANFQGGVIYNISADARVRVSGSHRTRFPTIKDKYSFRFGSALPNPGLQPEEATHFEIGLDGRWSVLDYGVNLFYSDVSDAIVDVTLAPTACFFPPCSQLQNVGEQENRGVEALASVQLGEQWRVNSNYTYLHRKNETAPNIAIIDTPKHKFFASMQYSPLPMLDFLATLEYNSKRYSSTFGDRVAQNFTLLGLKASWQPLQNVSADVGVNNVTDELYAYEEGFYESGRTWFVNLKYDY